MSVTVKRNVLIVLLILIVIAAHPWGPWYDEITSLWSVMHVLGIDVYFQPFTYEMMDPSGQVSLSQHALHVVYYQEGGERLIRPRDLPFHRWDVVTLWFWETVYGKGDTRAERYALCHTLRTQFGSGRGFKFQLDQDEPGAGLLGFNKYFTCP